MDNLPRLRQQTTMKWISRLAGIIHLTLTVLVAKSGAAATPFDAAPYGQPLPEDNGVMWEDPREIHRVVVRFKGARPPLAKLRLEYWGSRWPEQHLPKDHEPGGAAVGWMELGNWHQDNWRT